MRALRSEFYQISPTKNTGTSISTGNLLIVLLTQLVAYFIKLSSCTDQGPYQPQSLYELTSENIYLVLNEVNPSLKLDAGSSSHAIRCALDHSISKLATCTELNLSRRNLRKLPYSIFYRMPNLKKLDISDNPGIRLNLSNHLRLQDQLVELNVAGCSLIFEDLKDIFECKQLRVLDLSRNNLSSLEDRFARYYQEMVAAFGNSGLMKDSSHLYSQGSDTLEEQADDNDSDEMTVKCTGKSSGLLGVQFKTQLVELIAFNCQLRSTFLKVISECSPQLRKLDISRNNLSGMPVNFYSLSRTLVSLNMMACKLDLDIFNKPSHFESLEDLDVSLNNFAIVPKDFIFGNLISTLISLNIRSSSLNPKIFEKMVGFRSLRKLNLAHNNFKDISRNFEFGILASTVVDLNLSVCCITSNLFMKIGRFESLVTLDVSYNNLGLVPDAFEFGHNITIAMVDLNISACSLKPSIIERLTRFTSLEKLDLSLNNLNALPDDFDFGNLSVTLIELNISYCSLTSSMREKIGRFERLRR